MCMENLDGKQGGLAPAKQMRLVAKQAAAPTKNVGER